MAFQRIQRAGVISARKPSIRLTLPALLQQLDLLGHAVSLCTRFSILRTA
jgi:hypothetical protein